MDAPQTVLVTGSSGLVGSACVRHFHALGAAIHGLDNNWRFHLFGAGGDTRPTLARLQKDYPCFVHHQVDIRDESNVDRLVYEIRPDLIIHAAAQPSHDLAARLPLVDFDINARGTLLLLEAVRKWTPEAVFVFLSTNKVYGDWPNTFPVIETPTRWKFNRYDCCGGLDERVSIDRCLHSLFGVSKTAADLLVQEYGRYFGMRTCCLRCGCLTGGAHAAVELHGFLAYLVRCCVRGEPYTVYGYKGKQVRDQLHAVDVARAAECFWRNPRPGEVYNLGGGRENSLSVLEAIELVEQKTGKKLDWKYVDEPRKGDHCVYISDTTKFRQHYPGWSVSVGLEAIVDDLIVGVGA